HAARTGEWPDPLSPEFSRKVIAERQNSSEKMFRGTAYFHNLYILACNAVGSATEGLEGVVSNHAGTVMGVDPDGEVFLRTGVSEIVDEVVTVELKASRRKVNHGPSRNRRWPVVKQLFDDALKDGPGL
ncbi:MAG: hypothetical protein JSU61_12425, partial [Fidelibacterota bacterium]